MTERRAVKAPPWADAGVQLVEKLVEISNHADMYPVVFGRVDGRTLAATVLRHVRNAHTSSPRDDGLFLLDLGYVQTAWIVHTDGSNSCVSFFVTKVLDMQSAVTSLRELYDSLNAVARTLGCSVGSISDGMVDGRAADIIVGGWTMSAQDLFG